MYLRSSCDDAEPPASTVQKPSDYIDEQMSECCDRGMARERLEVGRSV